MSSRWELFRNRSFVSYWLGYLLSQIGDHIFTVTVGYMIVKATGSGLVMGTFLLVMGVPRLLFMLIGGVMVDRLDPRLVMALSDLVRALMLSLLFLLSLDGFPTLWALYALAAVFGTADAFYWPAVAALRQRIVREESYAQSNGVLIGTMQGAVIVGPMIGAGVLAWNGFQLGIALDALSYVLSAVTLFFVRLLPRQQNAEQRQEKRSFAKELSAGLRFVLGTPLLLSLIIIAFFCNAGVNGVMVGMPFLSEAFGTGASGYAQLITSWGVGGLIGGVILSLFVIRQPTPRMILLCFFMQGVVVLLVGYSTAQWQAMGLMAVAGMSSAGIQIFMNSVNQSIIPTELMGRVYSVRSLVSMGSTPFSQGVAGWALDVWGVFILYVVGGLIPVVAAGIGMCLPAVRGYGKRRN